MRSRLPTMRKRRRYILFEVEAEKDIEEKDLVSEIHFAQVSLFGDLGASQNRLKLIRFDGRYGLLRCSHLHLKESKAVLATIYSINGTRAALKVLRISGTIKAGTEKYIPQLSKIATEADGEIVEIDGISGWIARKRGREIDLIPDERNGTRGSDTKYLGLTSFDFGGCDDADGTSDGL